MLEPKLGQKPPDGVYVAHLEDVTMVDPEWLVRGYLLAGELTVLQGHGGTSKGTLAVAWAAMVSRGNGEAQTEPQHVLWASAEDSIGRVLKPRLIAAGADLNLVKPFGYRREGIEDALSLPDDVSGLRDAVEELDVGLVVIDPLLSHLSGKIDSYRDHEVKRALRPLAHLANETGCAVLGIHHLGKDTSRGAYLSGQASGAFGNTARMVLAIAEHDEDDMVRVLEVVKTNVSKKGLRKAMRVELVTVPPLREPVASVIDAGEADKTVDELLSKRPAKGEKRANAKAIILRELDRGRRKMDYLKAKVAAEVGASGDTTWKAANELKAEGLVDRKPEGVGGDWYWFLTEAAQTSASGPANPHDKQTSVHTTKPEVWRLPYEDQTSVASDVHGTLDSSPSKPIVVVGDAGYVELLAGAYRNGHLTETEAKARHALHRLITETVDEQQAAA